MRTWSKAGVPARRSVFTASMAWADDNWVKFGTVHQAAAETCRSRTREGKGSVIDVHVVPCTREALWTIARRPQRNLWRTEDVERTTAAIPHRNQQPSWDKPSDPTSMPTLEQTTACHIWRATWQAKQRRRETRHCLMWPYLSNLGGPLAKRPTLPHGSDTTHRPQERDGKAKSSSPQSAGPRA